MILTLQNKHVIINLTVILQMVQSNIFVLVSQVTPVMQIGIAQISCHYNAWTGKKTMQPQVLNVVMKYFVIKHHLCSIILNIMQCVKASWDTFVILNNHVIKNIILRAQIGSIMEVIRINVSQNQNAGWYITIREQIKHTISIASACPAIIVTQTLVTQI